MVPYSHLMTLMGCVTLRILNPLPHGKAVEIKQIFSHLENPVSFTAMFMAKSSVQKVIPRPQNKSVLSIFITEKQKHSTAPSTKHKLNYEVTTNPVSRFKNYRTN